MADVDGTELRSILSNRFEVLDSLIGEWRSKPDLVNTLPYSRSTIDRAVEDLRQAGCLVKSNSTYHASPTGQAVYERHKSYREHTDGIAAARQVLNAVDVDDPLVYSIFNNPEVYVSNPQTPEVGVQRSIEIVEDATLFRGYASTTFKEYFDVHIEQLQRDTFSSDLIIERELYDQIQTHFSDRLDTLLAQDGLTMYVTDEYITYSPWLAEQPATIYAGMTVYDEGAMQGVIVSDSDAAVTEMQKFLSSLIDSAVVAE